MSKWKLGASTGRSTVLLLGIAILIVVVGFVVYGVLEETGAIDSISSMIDSISSSTSATSDEASQPQSQQQQQQASSIVAQIEGIDQAMESNLQEQEYWYKQTSAALSHLVSIQQHPSGGSFLSTSVGDWSETQQNLFRLQREYHQLLQDKLDLILELQLALY